MSSAQAPKPPKKKKYAFAFNDLLPAALVLDMRQFARSPIYLLFLLAGIVFAYKQFFAEDGEISMVTLMSVHLIIMMLFVPTRAGMTIARDIRERGSNFLQLCPLSAGNIVWGQFLSAALQQILITLAIAPLYYTTGHHLRQALSENAYISSANFFLLAGEWNTTILLAVVLCIGLASAALMMALALLPLFFRLALQLGGVFMILVWALSVGFTSVDLSFIEGGEALDTGARLSRYLANSYAFEYYGSLGLIIALLAFSLMMLILASRHYASDAEASSGKLRLLNLATMAGLFAGLIEFIPAEKLDCVAVLYGYLLVPFLAVAMLDELMPRDVDAGISSRRRGLFGFLTRRGTAANIIFMLGMGALYAAGSWYLNFAPAYINESTPNGDLNVQIMMVSAPVIAIILSALAPMVICDAILCRSSRLRLVGYAISTVFIVVVGVMMGFNPPETPFPIFCVFNSIYDFDESIPSLLLGDGIALVACCLLLALVHALRKRR